MGRLWLNCQYSQATATRRSNRRSLDRPRTIEWRRNQLIPTVSSRVRLTTRTTRLQQQLRHRVSRPTTRSQLVGLLRSLHRAISVFLCCKDIGYKLFTNLDSRRCFCSQRVLVTECNWLPDLVVRAISKIWTSVEWSINNFKLKARLLKVTVEWFTVILTTCWVVETTRQWYKMTLTRDVGWL